MSDPYDAIVIGSGLGGLTAAALSARAGARVLVLEQHTLLGGAATVFQRKGLQVEVGLHELDGLDEGDIKRNLWLELELDEHLEFVPVPQFYAVHHDALPGGRFVMPDGRDAALAAATEAFPAHAAALRTYFDTLEGLRRKLRVLTDNEHSIPWWILNGPIFPLRFWPVLRHGRTTVGQFMQQLFGDDEAVKIALCPNLSYYSDTPEMSLVFFAGGQASYHHGGYYVKGGSQALSDQLAQQVRDRGGDTLTGRPATRILVEGGKVAGVIHCNRKGEDAQEVRAPLVFGNASPPQLASMLPDEQRAGFVARYASLRPSTSLWSLYLGFDRDPTELGMDHYSSFFVPGWVERFDQSGDGWKLMGEDPGERLPRYSAVNYSRIDHGLESEGLSLVVLCGTDRLDNWRSLAEAEYRARKEAWREAIVADLIRRHPGLEPHLKYSEMATARTVHRYLRTPGGAVYGWAQDPDQAMLKRPSAKTPVSGLLLASAFARPGGGFTGAMLAGHHAFCAARRVLGGDR